MNIEEMQAAKRKAQHDTSLKKLNEEYSKSRMTGMLGEVNCPVEVAMLLKKLNDAVTLMYELSDAMCRACEHMDDMDIIEDMPAADVQPVKHGKWEETHISLVKYIPEDEKEEGHSFYMAELKCSCCKRYNAVTFALTLNKPDFCQLCGARMNLKDGDTNGRTENGKGT